MRTPEYVDNETFVKVWESFDTIDEIADEIAQICQRAGRPAPSKAVICAKASNLRAAGVALSKKRRVSETSNETVRLNFLIAQVQTNLAKGIKPIIPELPKAIKPPKPRLNAAKEVKKLIEGA